MKYLFTLLLLLVPILTQAATYNYGSITNGPAFVSQITDVGIMDPSAPTAITVGTAGSTTYIYYIVCHDINGGVTNVSPSNTLTTGNATLNGTNYNSVAFTKPTNAINCDILRGDTAHSATGGLAVVTSPFLDQNNATVGGYSAPIRNTTGDWVSGGGIQQTIPTASLDFGNINTEDWDALAFNGINLPHQCSSVQPGQCLEGFVVGATIPSTSTKYQYNGISSYILNHDVYSGLGGTNPVGIYSQVGGLVSNSITWPLNTVASTAPSITGATIQNEFDFNSSNTADTVIGLLMFGGSTATPATSQAFDIRALGTGHPWQLGYYSEAGAANVGLLLGPLGTGASQPSQPIDLVGTTSGSAHVTAAIEADANGDLDLIPPSGESTVFSTPGGGGSGISGYIGAGMVLGAATSGDLGLGKLNVASGVFLNNTAYTNPDYVFDAWASGSEVKGYSILSLAADEAYAKQHHELPRMVDFDAKGKAKASDIFHRADRVLEKVEEAHIYLWDYEHRIKALEKELGNSKSLPLERIVNLELTVKLLSAGFIILLLWMIMLQIQINKRN